MNEPIIVKIYGRGRGKFSGYRALTEYCFTEGTEKQAVVKAKSTYRAKLGGMKPEVVEIGGCRYTPGGGKVMWTAKGVTVPVISFN